MWNDVCDVGWRGWNHMFYGGGLMGLLFIILIVILVYFLIRNWQGSNVSMTNATREEDPMAILKKRYAKGEISKEEYEAIKKDL